MNVIGEEKRVRLFKKQEKYFSFICNIFFNHRSDFTPGTKFE